MLRESQEFFRLPLSERIRLAREHVNRPESDYQKKK